MEKHAASIFGVKVCRVRKLAKEVEKVSIFSHVYFSEVLLYFYFQDNDQ
jgi:hypothetical protein